MLRVGNNIDAVRKVGIIAAWPNEILLRACSGCHCYITGTKNEKSYVPLFRRAWFSVLPVHHSGHEQAAG